MMSCSSLNGLTVLYIVPESLDLLILTESFMERCATMPFAVDRLKDSLLLVLEFSNDSLSVFLSGIQFLRGILLDVRKRSRSE